MNTKKETSKENLHYVWPNTIRKYEGSFYLHRPHIQNQFSEHFNVKLYCKVKKVSDIDQGEFRKLNDEIEVIDFFGETSFQAVLKQFSKYKNKFSNLPDTGYYFVLYPYKRTSIVLAYLLKNKNLTIWVKSLSGIKPLPHPNKVMCFLKRLLLPLRRFVYKSVSRKIFNSNLVFYTSDIVIDTENHINQHALVSCSNFNRDISLIKKQFTNSICFVGDESPRKGLHVLFKALHKISESNRPALNIIGMDTISNKKNEILADNLNIELHGKIYQRDLFYQKLADNDILVMPSFAEKQGKVQLEAMSAGVVPICSDSGGTHRTINNFYNGLLFPPGNSRALGEKIQTLYSDKDLYGNLQENGVDFVSDISIEDQVSKMNEIMKNFFANKND